MAEVTPHACRAIFAILMKFALPVKLLKYHEKGPFVSRIGIVQPSSAM